jgi:long-chain fatty acid transport protein
MAQGLLTLSMAQEERGAAMKREWVVGVLAAAALSIAVDPVGATDGYFANGYGTNYKAMAGAGVALSLGTQAPATNPAAMAFLGRRFDVGLELFNPNREFSVTGAPSGFPGTFGLAPGRVESGSRYFPIPSLGANWKVGDKGSFGISAYGNGGMNTSYTAPVFGVAPAGVEMSQMFLAPTYAYRIAPHHALGVAAILAYQRFKAKGLQAFGAFSSDTDCLTNNGHANSYGAGVRVGYLGELNGWLSIGASYQTRIAMTKLAKYAGLFADRGGFDVPQTFTGGVAVNPVARLTAALDVQWINYESITSVANDFLPNLATALLGTTAGAGFGWHDMTVYKAGLQYEASPLWTLRAGYSYGREPIRDNEVLINILAPGVMEHHVSAGVTRLLNGGKALNLAITRALPKTIAGPNNLEAPNRQSIALKMDQWELDLSYSFGF